MIDNALSDCKVQKSGVLHLWSDCGPHFRSMENLANHLELARARKQEVRCCFLAEQHGKNILDAAFGAVSQWLSEHALKKPVHTVKQLVSAIKDGAAAAMKADPKGPKWHCKLVDFGRFHQQKTLYVKTSDFKITRSYCFVARPPYGVLQHCSLENKVFADIQGERRLCSYELAEMEREEPEEWKRSFYEGHKTWEEEPPDIGDVTVLHRRFESQKHKPPREGLRPIKTFEERVRAKSLKTLKDRARAERQMAALKGEDHQETDSDSSSSSSTSSDNDSD